MENVRLDRRPEARSFTVERLLLDVRDGKIRVPDFQRPLRWRSSHVLDLFDSIYRGFPVGTLLLSKGEAGPGRLHFGPLVVDAPAMTDAYFVVDGQQRITALAGAMLHPDKHPRGDIHAVWFDLENDKFVRVASAEPPLSYIPLNVAGNHILLSKWMDDWPLRNDRPDLRERAYALCDALRFTEIPAYIVERASKEVLRRIFKRTNTSGVGMKDSEVFEALYGATGPRPIASACMKIEEETGFGQMDHDWFLRCLWAVEGRDPLPRSPETDVTGLSPDAVLHTEIALRRAVTFLVEDAGVPHMQLMPYRLPLIVLARFFHLHEAPEPRARALLVRWVWRGALSGVHTACSYAAVRDLQRRIDADRFGSIERLLQKVPERIKLPKADTLWNGRSAETRLCALALVHLCPRDPESGEPLTIPAVQDLLAEKAIGDIFVDAGGSGHKSLACHLLLPDRSRLARLPDAPAEVRESHALDEKAARALRRRDMEAFERSRARVLDRWLARFFTERAAIGESDRPAIAEIVRRVDAKATAA